MKKLLLFSALLGLGSFAAIAQPAVEWKKSYGGTQYEHIYDVNQTRDGGYIVAGNSDSNDGDLTSSKGNNDIWVVRTNDTGKILWQKSFGGSLDEDPGSIQQTSDGGFIMGGASRSDDGDISGNIGTWDFWVVKMDSLGNIEWEKNYGGMDEDRIISLQQTNDGGYIAVGNTYSSDVMVTDHIGRLDIWVVKLSATGAVEWKKSYGGTQMDDPTKVLQTADSGYIITAYSDSKDVHLTKNNGDWDFWVLKISKTGAIQWQKSYGGSAADYPWSIIQSLEGGYMVIGESKSNDLDVSGNKGDYDYWALKIDDTGNIQWQKTFGGTEWDFGRAICQLADSTYVATGISRSADGDIKAKRGLSDDVWTLAFSTTGALLWEKSFGGDGSDYGYCMKTTKDNGVILGCVSSSSNKDFLDSKGNGDIWLIKLKGDEKPTSIYDLSATQEPIMLYPNPAQNKIYIQGATLSANEYSIVDVNGKLIQKEKLATDRSIDVSALQPGCYWISVSDMQTQQSSFAQFLKH